MTERETVDLGELFAKIYDGDDEEEDMDWTTTDYTHMHPDCYNEIDHSNQQMLELCPKCRRYNEKYLKREMDVCDVVIDKMCEYAERNESPQSLVDKYFDRAIRETDEYARLVDTPQDEVDEWTTRMRQMTLYRLESANDCT